MQELDTDSVVDTGPARETEGNLVDVGAAHRDSNLEEILDELDDELVGLKPVKAYKLTAIAELMLRQQNYAFDPESRQAFVEYLALRIKQPHFANARSVRNAIDRIKLRQASRLVGQGGCIAKEQLVRIAAIDIRQSRVFQGGSDVELEGMDDCGAGEPRRKEA